MNLKSKFSKLISGFTAAVMCLSMLPNVSMSSDAASVGQKLSVGGGQNQHKGVCDGYSYEIWLDTTGGSGTMTLGSGATFKAEWSASVPSGNFLARRGLDFGSQKKATDYPYIGMDYKADYRQTGSNQGNSRLCVYGWFQNKGLQGVPLVEYYIIEDWVDWCPDGNGKIVTIDGAQYKIFQQQHSGPSINSGYETFMQYFSVRQDKRKSGHITVSDHFKAWADQGWGIGNLYEVALNAEGWQSSGVADITELDVYTEGSPTPTEPTDPPEPEPTISFTKPSGSGSGVSDGFEGSGTDWTGRGEVSYGLTSDFAHGGSKSLYVEGRTESWNGFTVASDELEAGGSYDISLYAGFKSNNYDSMGYTLGVQYDAGGTTEYVNLVDATGSSGKWSELATDFDIPSNASNISLYVQSSYTETASASDLIPFFIDDVKLTKQGGGKDDDDDDDDDKDTGTKPNYSSDSLVGKFGHLFKMGTSVSPNELNGSGADFIKKHFNSITPENALKPEAIIDKTASQQKGNNVNTQISLNQVASTLKFCEDNNIGVRGHTFVWYSQTPDWFFRENFSENGAYVSTDVMDQRLESMIKNTFEAIATQYPDLNLYAYDVCNELFLNDGGGLRPASNSNWVRVYGDDSFVIKAFEYARKYAPKGCKLYINDYNEYIDAKTDDIYNMAMKLKEKGLIDGIGMQSHLDVGYPSATIYKKALERFLSTGLEVSITELDITESSPNSQAQADLYEAIFDMAVDNYKQIPSFTVWGTHDDISWRSPQTPLMFSSNYSPKKAYYAVMDLDVPEDGDEYDNNDGGNDDNDDDDTTPGVTATLAGDANCDGYVTIADATAILQHLGNPDKYGLSDKGMANADVDGSVGITANDALQIKKYDAKMIDELTVTQSSGKKTTVTTTKTTVKTTTTTKATSANFPDPTKPMVAISFDDGTDPNGKKIIDALAKEGFTATFFYVGNWIDDPDQVKYAYSKGMEVANHTTTHPYLTNLSSSEIRSEYDQCYSKLKSIIGAEPSKLLRLPYLASNGTVTSTLSDVPMITSAIDTEDWNGASKDQIVGKVKGAIQNGSANGAIILCHETYASTAAAIEELAPYCKSQGWQIVSISEMFAAKGQKLNGGQIYTKCN